MTVHVWSDMRASDAIIRFKGKQIFILYFRKRDLYFKKMYRLDECDIQEMQLGSLPRTMS